MSEVNSDMQFICEEAVEVINCLWKLAGLEAWNLFAVLEADFVFPVRRLALARVGRFWLNSFQRLVL